MISKMYGKVYVRPRQTEVVIEFVFIKFTNLHYDFYINPLAFNVAVKGSAALAAATLAAVAFLAA